MIWVLLVDDHAVVRQGLRTLLEAEGQFQVVGETGDGLEAVSLAERLRPNILLVDLMLPGISGLEVVRRVARTSPHTRGVILSMHAGDAYVQEALRSGAYGYVLKDAGAEELFAALREVAAGRRYLTPMLSERLLAADGDKAHDGGDDPYERLSPREREVLHLAAEGHNNVDIGARLGISPRTVETHRTNLMRKLVLRTYTDLVKFAIRRGIVNLEE
jgi:DNA-binding NarL/FixJ family response regulator